MKTTEQKCFKGQDFECFNSGKDARGRVLPPPTTTKVPLGAQNIKMNEDLLTFLSKFKNPAEYS